MRASDGVIGCASRFGRDSRSCLTLLLHRAEHDVVIAKVQEIESLLEPLLNPKKEGSVTFCPGSALIRGVCKSIYLFEVKYSIPHAPLFHPEMILEVKSRRLRTVIKGVRQGLNRYITGMPPLFDPC